MIEVYAFLAAFAVQILIMSVLYPIWFERWLRVRMAGFDAERLAQMYPGIDFNDPKEWRVITHYRMLHTAIAVLGVLLLGWFFYYMQRPDWDIGTVRGPLPVYFMLQILLPQIFIIQYSLRYNKLYKHDVPEVKRKAVLKRRGLFDFVSPFAIFLAILAYALYAAFLIYVQQHPFPGFAGPLRHLGPLTLAYALHAFIAYKCIYGKNNRLNTHADRLHLMGLTVKICVYVLIAVVLFMSLNLTIKLLDLKTWQPFMLSVFFLIITVLMSMNLIAPPRKPETDAFGANTAS